MKLENETFWEAYFFALEEVLKEELKLLGKLIVAISFKEALEEPSSCLKQRL